MGIPIYVGQLGIDFCSLNFTIIQWRRRKIKLLQNGMLTRTLHRGGYIMKEHPLVGAYPGTPPSLQPT